MRNHPKIYIDKMEQPTFNLGDKVIVNTGGNDSKATIDLPTQLLDIYGKKRKHYLTGEDGTHTSYLCRFTRDEKQLKYLNSGSGHANAQFIPTQFIKLDI